MQTHLEQTFNETAAAAYEAFPQELEKLVVLLVPSSDTPVFISPQVADQLTKDTAAIKKAVTSLTTSMQIRGAAGLANRYYYLAGTRVNLIALDNKNPLGVFSRRFTKEMSLLFALDHEIGHHILKNGYPTGKVSGQLAESAASAYAALRHIQRFGTNTLGAEGERAAHTIVLRSNIEHYTTDAVHKALQIPMEEISGLSLHETAALAEKIADECRLDYKTLEKIRAAFRPVYESCKKHIGGNADIAKKLYAEDREAYTLFCRETVSVMRSHPGDPDIFKAGKEFLNYPPVRKFMTEAAQTDSSWQRTLGFIDNHDPARSAMPRKNINLKP